MNFIVSPEKIHSFRKPSTKSLRELTAGLALAPCEINNPLICRHFKLPTKQQIERQIQVETLRLEKRGMCP